MTHRLGAVAVATLARTCPIERAYSLCPRAGAGHTRPALRPAGVQVIGVGDLVLTSALPQLPPGLASVVVRRVRIALLRDHLDGALVAAADVFVLLATVGSVREDTG